MAEGGAVSSANAGVAVAASISAPSERVEKRIGFLSNGMRRPRLRASKSVSVGGWPPARYSRRQGKTAEMCCGAQQNSSLAVAASPFVAGTPQSRAACRFWRDRVQVHLALREGQADAMFLEQPPQAVAHVRPDAADAAFRVADPHPDLLLVRVLAERRQPYIELE